MSAKAVAIRLASSMVPSGDTDRARYSGVGSMTVRPVSSMVSVVIGVPHVQRLVYAFVAFLPAVVAAGDDGPHHGQGPVGAVLDRIRAPAQEAGVGQGHEVNHFEPSRPATSGR